MIRTDGGWRAGIDWGPSLVRTRSKTGSVLISVWALSWNLAVSTGSKSASRCSLVSLSYSAGLGSESLAVMSKCAESAQPGRPEMRSSRIL